MKTTSAFDGVRPEGLVGVAARLVEHADLLAGLDIGGLDEDGAITAVRSNEKVVRLLGGISASLGARLGDLGGLSAADVFSTAGRLSDGAARSVERRAALLGVMPNVGAGCVAGTIGCENVDSVAIARHKLRHDSSWLEAFDARDVSVARKAARMRPKAFRAWLGELVSRISDDGETDVAANKQLNKASIWHTKEGRWRGRFDLDALAGEQVKNALAAEARSIVAQAQNVGSEPFDGSGVHHGERVDAEALVGLIGSGNGARGRASINLIADLETVSSGVWEGTLKRTGRGADVPLSELRRLLCDAWVTHNVMGPSGRALAVGRSYRTATDAQRAALRVMYETCACCETSFDECEIHHIIEWENGGLTDLVNLIPLCRIHHDQMHSGGWSITMDPERTVTVRRPDHSVWAVRPLPSAGPAAKRSQHRERSLGRSVNSVWGADPPGSERSRSIE
ncbi:MAG: DUF222 domain-containing protein [Acidimicrobiales bacterium]|nr:DUF222 domain-containing protein [Acidimicrobiales bacterium]